MKITLNNEKINIWKMQGLFGRPQFEMMKLAAREEFIMQKRQGKERAEREYKEKTQFGTVIIKQ